MKWLLVIPLLLLVSCADDPLDKTKQFLPGMDSQLHCPKCSSTPKGVHYQPKEASTTDGANDHEHFEVWCAVCGLDGWATIPDAKRAVEACRK